MKKLLVAFLAMVIMLVPATSHADFKRICRGANIVNYENEIRQATKEKLKLAGISFSGVKVEVKVEERQKDIYVNDFSEDLTIGAGEKPFVSFSGAFPDVSACTIPAKLVIRVRYPDGFKAVTVSSITLNGTLLQNRSAKDLAED